MLQLGDQRGFEQEIWAQGEVPCEFATFEEIYHNSRVNEVNEFIYKDQYLVTVAYYRAGYTPNDYPEELQWDTRSRIEHSNCIKLPSIGYHLVGAKAIQASLCKPNVLERYLTVEEADLLRKCFAEQYALAEYYTPSQSNPALHAQIGATIAKAKQSGDAWVLKPQREGGGNNFYNHELSALLKEHDGKGATEDNILPGYVLMQRIFPADQLTAFYRKGELMLLPSLSELGIFGSYIGYGENVPEGEEKVVQNDYTGYLLRTKVEGVDEGGVATGFSVINSISLFDY
jgi:glutathione synthetase